MIKKNIKYKRNEPIYKDRRYTLISKIAIYIVAGLFATYAIYMFTIVHKSIDLEYENGIAGRIINIESSKGTVLLKLESEQNYWRIRHSQNYDLSPSALSDFLMENDLVNKEPFSDTLKIKRNEEVFIYIIGNIGFNYD